MAYRGIYPPAPWTLGGWGIATVGLVDSRAAAAFLPAGAELISVLPGKTLGGLFFLSYEYGSLAYRELNIIAGLVRVGMRFAFLLPRLYVDSTASLAGGRDIWAVPKELATFTIDEHDAGMTAVDVRQGTRRVCRLRCTKPAPGVRLPIALPAFGVRDEAFLFFTAKLLATASPARAEVTIPADGDFAGLGLERPFIAVRCDNVRLVVPAPRAVVRALELAPLPAPSRA